MRKGNLLVVMFALALAASFAFVPTAQAMLVVGDGGLQASDGYQSGVTGGLQASDGYQSGITGLRASDGYQSGLATGGLGSGGFTLGGTVPGKWGPAAFGTPATVTYSYMATGTSCAAEFAGCTVTAIPAGFVAAIDAAFAAWSAVAGVTFTLVADSGAGCAFNAAGCVGDIRIGMHVFDGPFGVLAHAFFPPANGVTAAGDLHFDVGECYETVSDGTGDGCFNIRIIAEHEIGHSIGLGHTAVPCSLMNPIYDEACGAIAADDTAGAVFLYGPPAAQVPFPATLVLAGAGLLGFGVAIRKRRA